MLSSHILYCGLCEAYRVQQLVDKLHQNTRLDNNTAISSQNAADLA
jgi:hypothetical protein